MTQLVAPERPAVTASVVSCHARDLSVRSRRVGAPAGPREAERRVDEILDAAVRAIAAKGIAAISIDDVARAAGISKGTFYHYFRSRDALLEGLFARHEASLNSLIEADRWFKGNARWERRAAHFARIVYGTAVAGLDLAATWDVAAEWSRCEGARLPHLRLVRQFICDGAARGYWQVADVSTVAAFIHGGAFEILREAASDPVGWRTAPARIGYVFVGFLHAFASTEGEPFAKG